MFNKQRILVSLWYVTDLSFCICIQRATLTLLKFDMRKFIFNSFVTARLRWLQQVLTYLLGELNANLSLLINEYALCVSWSSSRTGYIALAIQGLLETFSQSAIESKRFSGELKRPQRHLFLSHFSADLKLNYSYVYSSIIEKAMLFFFTKINFIVFWYIFNMQIYSGKTRSDSSAFLKCSLNISLNVICNFN